MYYPDMLERLPRFNFALAEDLLMNTCTKSAGSPNPQPNHEPAMDTVPGRRFAFGLVFFRPQACQQLCHVDVLGALLRHLAGSFGELNPADLADETRPVSFLAEHSNHFAGAECLHLSAFRDHHGTPFYLLTLADWTTVVSLPEEF